MREAALGAAREAGWRAAIVPLACYRMANERIRSLCEEGKVDKALYEDFLAPREQEDPWESYPNGSLIVVAAPDQPTRVRFSLKGRVLSAVIPPTYLQGAQKELAMEQQLRDVLEPAGYSVARVEGPVKTAAALSGLARYGKNGLAYVPEMGSYHQPVMLVSDLPSEGTAVSEPEALPRCSTCNACRFACPTGAISAKGFLVDLERCLTYWNEEESDVPFPDWIKPEWHNALVGCMRCQEACPENQPFAGSFVEGPSFNELATRSLLAGAPQEELAPELRQTLEEWGFLYLLGLLRRNLRALLAKEGIG